jgi:hypothetical protein
MQERRFDRPTDATPRLEANLYGCFTPMSIRGST